MRKGLTRRVAETIDGAAFGCTPAMYGLATQAELRERTWAGMAQKVAEDKARKIIRMVRDQIED